MDRVTNRLLRELLPGITTVAPRPRYIAHHLWALRDVTRNDESDSRAQLLRGLYRRERILLLSGMYHEQDRNDRDHNDIVGSRTARSEIEPGGGSIDLDFSFASNRSGSYGRNYAGPLQTMGLVSTADGAICETPTERGTPIADAYDRLADGAGLSELAGATDVSSARLREIAPALCPCAVSDPDAPDREPLRELYLARNPPDKYASRARTRRESLALFLYIAQLEGDLVPLEPGTLLDACYYETVMTEGDPVPVDLPSSTRGTAARWKALRAHDYFAYGIESVLTSWLAYLTRTEEADATPQEFKQQARSGDVCQRLGKHTGLETLSPGTPLSELLASVWPGASAAALQDGTPVPPVPVTHELSEYRLDSMLGTALSNQNWEKLHATWPCLLLAVLLRFATRTGEDQEAWNWLRLQTEEDLTPVRLHRDVRTRVENECSFGEFVDWIIDSYVIKRGVEVARQKTSSGAATRGYFEQTATGWRQVRDHSPEHWSARFDSAVSVLRDLALLNPDPSTVSVTQAGARFLDQERK